MDLKVLGERAFAHDGGVRFDPSRPVVVLIHGAGSDHTAWRFQSRHLAHRGLAVLAPDLPAHGRSAGPVRQSIPDLAAWVAALLDEVGADEAALVGHSMGSLVALECAASHTGKVRRLVMISTSSQMKVHPDLQAAADSGDPVAIELMAGWSFTGASRMGGHPGPGLWMEGAFRRLLEQALTSGSLARDLEACSRYRPLDRAPAVSCPTLVLAGAADVMTPAPAGRALAEAIAGSRFEMIDGAGHNSLFVHPDAIRRELDGFLIP